MWTRKELKDRAKEVLRGIYWKAFGVSIVIALAGANGGGGGGGGNSSHSRKSAYSNIHNGSFIDWKYVITIIALITLLVAAFRIFIGYSLEVGGRKYFIQSAQYEDNKKCFSFAFEKQNYKGIVLAMLLKGVKVLLWALLLIIPGIIKSYEYRMVPYILADNPSIGAKEALALSSEMTNGHKFKIFVLDLSFIGWYLLGVLALGFGILFVMPYQNATEAELYLMLSRNKS